MSVNFIVDGLNPEPVPEQRLLLRRSTCYNADVVLELNGETILYFDGTYGRITVFTDEFTKQGLTINLEGNASHG